MRYQSFKLKRRSPRNRSNEKRQALRFNRRQRGDKGSPSIVMDLLKSETFGGYPINAEKSKVKRRALTWRP